MGCISDDAVGCVLFRLLEAMTTKGGRGCSSLSLAPPEYHWRDSRLYKV